jgi:hypothetical protein
MAIALYEFTREERYNKCTDLLRQQLAARPRTIDCVFPPGMLFSIAKSSCIGERLVFQIDEGIHV